jgi:hypothetical protein
MRIHEQEHSNKIEGLMLMDKNQENKLSVITQGEELK